MSYLGLHVTNGSPTGENVDPVAALSNNYQTIDTKIAATENLSFGVTPTLANGEAGMELVTADSLGSVFPFEQQLYVSDGTNWHKTDLHETWGSWITIPLAATAPLVVGGSGNTPQWRSSSWGRIELRGVIQPSTGVFTLNVWKMFYDGSVDTSALRAIGNRPASSVSIGSNCNYFQVVATSVPQSTPVGAETTCVICIVNDSTFTYMQMYYMFSETSTTPSAQHFNLDGIVWDKAVGGYAGNTV